MSEGDFPPRPRKRFGQHFLVDRSVVARILESIAPEQSDRIVEIGPGQAALTAPLLERVGRLDAIEIDRDLAQRLKQRFPEKLQVHVGDALKFDFPRLGSDLRIVGNLPYNISTPLLFRLADFASSIRDAHVTLQKEVVERMIAEPSSKEYGRLSVMLQLRFRMRKLFEVHPRAFRPAPEVESAVVRMAPLACPPAADYALIKRVATAAFSKRRKQLKNALAGVVPAEAWERLELAPELRPEDLSVADFLRIASYLARAEDLSAAG
ncbi:MAG TPA: 16S rRNA (adenine(1518)-N(6)/adenine(1519)-N(6))-dimethyltransferase RsmA [Burkholderiales bacterium]|nr:16S rRNA (adenine(1518)-N(6)/adenine(1519)-N(6))-dimethyltransferase RsmA [Burkholderiales bacterium]